MRLIDALLDLVIMLLHMKQAQKDFLKALGTGSLMSVSFAILNHTWFTDHQSLSMIGVFALGYLAIIFEEKVALNKSGVALLMAVALWTIRATSVSHDLADHELESKVAEVSSIVFFLIGAMTIVETIDAHKVYQSQNHLMKKNSPPQPSSIHFFHCVFNFVGTRTTTQNVRFFPPSPPLSFSLPLFFFPLYRVSTWFLTS